MSFAHRSGSVAAVCVALLLSACASLSADEDPTQLRLNDIDNRLTRIERVVANQSLLQLSSDLDALRSDVKSLRNEVDQLNNGMEASRKQQRDLYADLDQRIKSLEGRGGAAVSAAGSGAAAGADTGAAAGGDGTDQGNYQAAFALLKNSQYDRAIAAFRQFLVSFPQSPLAENAQYWLGEAYYVNKDFPNALQAFRTVTEKYPQSRKLADAQLKIGFCQYELKQWPSARETLSQVVAQYPDTSAGRLAQQRLQKMSSEKH